MIDPRLISSGIESGRSLAGQGPPIREMLGMKMQQNQVIAEIMKELLKAHMTDIADLRKTQFNFYYKALTDPNLDDERDPKTGKSPREVALDKIMDMDMSGWGAFESMFSGKLGKKDKVVGAPITGGAQDILAETSQAPENYYTTRATTNRPSFMQGAGRVAGQTAMAPIRGMTTGVDTLLRGLKRPGTTATIGKVAGQAATAPVAPFQALINKGKDQYGFIPGQSKYKGYIYIGNNQWQKQ